MPDPVVRQAPVMHPSAYQTTTPPVHQSGTSNSVGRNFMSGASAGSAFGPYGALIGAGVGLATDLWQARYAKERAKEANEEAKKAAALQAARAHNEAAAARNYNSEQAQIRRLRMAGLSPGLAYGQMSPSTAVAASPDKADINKADTPKFDNESILRALEYLVKQQQADTALAAQQSTADLQGSQTQLNLIDSLTRYQTNMAGITKVLADADFTDAQKLKLIKMLSGDLRIQEGQIKSLNQSARLAGAQADVVTPVANSQIASNYANARNLNANANVTEQTGVDLANSQIFNNNTSGLLHEQMREQMEYQYHLDKDQISALQDFMKSHGIDSSYAPVVLAALQSIAAGSGTTVNKAFDDLIHLPFNLIKTHIDYIMSARNSLMNIIK